METHTLSVHAIPSGVSHFTVPPRVNLQGLKYDVTHRETLSTPNISRVSRIQKLLLKILWLVEI